MVPRKRGRAEMESSEPAVEPGLLPRLRNMWEFANIMQYIFIFGKAVKIDEDFDIEDLEAECLKPTASEKLADIGLSLLKFVSSHRGLTLEIFDEYTRRQYLAKAPSRNPYGTEETPKRFGDFDIFTKLRVLVQLSQWTFANAERMRERMAETKDTEQTQWRMEEVGYDKEERLYFVLDDNRLYRRTDPALPPPPPPPSKPKVKPKTKSKAGKAAARASKRRKVSEIEDDLAQNEDEETALQTETNMPEEDHGFGGRKWECLAVTLEEYHNFLESIRKSRDVDEKALYQRLTKEVLPVIEKLEEDRQKKIARRQKELLNLEKLATAKRSSRIASKQERERDEQETAAAEKKRQADLIAAKQDAERQKHMDDARQSRMMTREQRVREREYKRLLHEEELANLSEDSKKLETGEARMSERHLKAEMEKKKRELEQLAQEDPWVFDCAKCGVHGENIDDGSHSIACEKCNVWQHSACLGVSQEEAEKDNVHFICSDCKRREEDTKRPKIPTLKFKLGPSSSPPTNESAQSNGRAEKPNTKLRLGSPMSTSSDKQARISLPDDQTPLKRKSIDSMDGEQVLPPSKKFKLSGPSRAPNCAHVNGQPSVGSMHHTIMHGPTLSPQGQLPSIQGGEGGSDVPPPGLASPVRPPAYSAGYSHSVSSMTQQRPNGHHPLLNGHGHTDPGPADPFHTNGDQEHLQDHSTPGQSRHSNSSYQSHNPYTHSFDRQQSSTSHSTSTLPPPTKTHPVGATSSSPLAHPPHLSATPTTNGFLPGQATIHSPSKPAHSSPPPPSLHHSSSPIIPPPSHSSQPTLPGLSPSKHSPPRPASSHSLAGTVIMPPTAHLSPSPQAQNLGPPVKGVTPERGGGVGGVNGR